MSVEWTITFIYIHFYFLSISTFPYTEFITIIGAIYKIWWILFLWNKWKSVNTNQEFPVIIILHYYISHGIFLLCPPPPRKIHFGVSEPSSFLHSHLYWQLKSKRISLYLQNSRDEFRSKFDCILDKRVENSKIKN